MAPGRRAMSRLTGAAYALTLLAVVAYRPVRAFIDQAVLGHSPLNPRENS